jgi:hypothetical protein
MYLAELHGKIPSRFKRMEDLLTSNIFSFFKYADRQVFLRNYLKQLGIELSPKEVKDAEFRFWPSLDDNTEPDLVIVAGRHYLMFEAKYFSDFGVETDKRKAQLLREIDGGIMDARNEGKVFKLIAITADHYYKKNKFSIITEKQLKFLKWTNWQQITAFLQSILEGVEIISHTDRAFALDLYSLLVKKNLRDYIGISIFDNIQTHLKKTETIFFDPKTAIFRGDFIGFINSLQFTNKIDPNVFKSTKMFKKDYFVNLKCKADLKPYEGTFFFEENKNEDKKRTH